MSFNIQQKSFTAVDQRCLVPPIAEHIMVSHCVNPGCRIEFKPFHGGYLYAHERRSADTEFFWLCSVCASQISPCLDPDGRIAVMLRSVCRRSQPPHADGYIRMVSVPTLHNPWRNASSSQIKTIEGSNRTDDPILKCGI